MEKLLPNTSLAGQPLKGDTFAVSISSSNVGPPTPFLEESAAGIKQSLSQTAVGQKTPSNVDEFLKLVVQPSPKPLGMKAESTLLPRQLWEGTVLECHEGSFVGRVVDLTNQANPEELVTFELDELSPEDRPLAQPGAAFYWTVGIEQSRAGQIKNVEMLNFRRLPTWTSSSVREAEKKAIEIAHLLFTE
jgi:hypothetical protein